ncbi:MAG TPA: phosphotransferase family protein [Stellaceae bacterium]|nr:phosphotransferase family protein [Stellaceae bacterium]
MLTSPEARRTLAAFLATASDATAVEITSATRLSGGSVQESWRIELAASGGVLASEPRLVLRADAPTQLAASRSRVEEFALLRAAHAAGVRVPEPLFCCTEPGLLGRPFFLMRWAPGTANGAALARDAAWNGRRDGLVTELGQQLAHIHGIAPPRPDLGFLGTPPADSAAVRLALYRRWLDGFEDPHPVAEWALRWLLQEKPAPAGVVLCHGDFRTGNFLVTEDGISAILDWEFAEWGDPHEDIGWLCCKSWRFGILDREVGGLGDRTMLYRAYESAGGQPVDPLRARYYEVMASLRWLILALQQRERFRRGGERSLDLALTGRRPSECEFELLCLIERAEQGE